MCQVDEVKNIMVENIEEVLKRGEKIEVLVDRTDDLRNHVRPKTEEAGEKSAFCCRPISFEPKDRNYVRRCGGRILR